MTHGWKQEYMGISHTAKNEKLKIAMLGHKRIPSREGGVEIVVEELSTRMSKQGHQVTCYNRRGHHVSGKQYDSERPSEYKGVRQKYAFTIEGKGIAAFTSSFFAVLKASFGRYDIVHFHGEGCCFMAWLPRLFGKKCVVTIHGVDWQREKWRGTFGARFIHFSERIAARFADEIIVLSRSVQEYFLDSYGRETRFIPNGVSKMPSREPDLIRQKYGLKKDSYLLFVGRIVPEKGIRYLVDAFSHVKTDKKLIIAGGSSDTDAFMEEMIALAKEDERIVFIGFVSGQLLEELYSNAYLYVLPSNLEGMPLSLLEAMSSSNCCVISDIPELTEVAQDHAVVFRTDDAIDLKDKLQMLCDDEILVQRYKGTVSDYICGKYNWDDVIDQTLKLYRDLL